MNCAPIANPRFTVKATLTLETLPPPVSSPAAVSQDGSFALDDDGAMLVASLVAAVYGSGDPRCNPAQCRRVQTGLLIGMYEVGLGRPRVASCKLPCLATGFM